MAASNGATDTFDAPVTPGDRDDVFEFPKLRDLPRPLVLAMLPWWGTLAPASWALLTGRAVLGLVLAGSGMVFSAAATAGYLIYSARDEE